MVKLVNFLSVLTVSLPEGMEFFFEVFLLLEQLLIQILVLSEVGLQPAYFNMSGVQDVFLGVQFSVQVGILLLPVYQQRALVVDLLSQGRNHANVGFHP